MTVHPQGEAVRKAVAFISEQRLAAPEASLGLLIRKACERFDLSPKDACFLEEFYAKKTN